MRALLDTCVISEVLREKQRREQLVADPPGPEKASDDSGKRDDIVISFCIMAQILVRNLDDDVKVKLQRRARSHGRSAEEEVREILRNAVKDEGVLRTPLGSRLAARFAGMGLTQEIPELRGQEVRSANLA